MEPDFHDGQIDEIEEADEDDEHGGHIERHGHAGVGPARGGVEDVLTLHGEDDSLVTRGLGRARLGLRRPRASALRAPDRTARAGWRQLVYPRQNSLATARR